MEKPVAVIILNWNGEKMLAKYLPQVISATDDTIADVIVADNGSDDGSLELLERSFPDVIVVKLDRNYGFAEGYNRAIAATDYRYTVLLNSDVAPATGWLNPLYDYMEAHPDVGACQPKIRSYADHKSFEYAGACGGFLDRNGYPYCRGRIFDTVERDSGQYDMVIPVFWASGAALMVRSELYVKVGGLDKDFFAHMEEIDLCVRIRRAGLKVVAISDSAVYHVGGASLNQGNPEKTYLNFRNNLLLLHKNLPRQKGRRILLFRRLADTLAFGLFLLKGDMPNARAILRAHSDFRKMKKSYSELPADDIFPRLPGTGRYAVASRYLLGKNKLKPKKDIYL